MQCLRVISALFFCVLHLDSARGAEPVDVEKAAAIPPAVSIVGIDSRCTFLRSNGEVAPPSWPINLANLGLKAGDLIQLDVVGDFAFSRGTPDEVTAMIGVFSSGPTLLPADWLKRVEGAIDAGAETATPPTMVGKRETDVAQDFPIASQKIRIPAGARYLFVAAPDIFYSDNVDPDADYAVRITRL